jgi:hypothetical protein
LLARRRCLLLIFIIMLQHLYESKLIHHFSACKLWVLRLLLVAYRLIESCSWTALLAHSSFQWTLQVTYLTKTVLRRWGVSASFASLLLWSPQVFW